MADAKQVQIRRDTAANLAITTPVEAELGFDQTNKRILVGDGIKMGGYPHPNFIDNRIDFFKRGILGGTANALTLTLSPSAQSYQTGMALKIFIFSSNTGPTVINVDGLGNKDIYKVSSGSLVALVSGDLVNGAWYEIIYDGTRFVLSNPSTAGITSVSQGDLNTSTGTFSSTFVAPTGGIDLIGWIIDASYSSGSYVHRVQPVMFKYINVNNNDFKFGSVVSRPGGEYGFGLGAQSVGVGASRTLYGQERYITSSPPYDLGDGEVAGFFFALVNKQGEIVGHYCADSPPWAYSGPTNIRAHRKCSVTGKKYRRVMKKRSFEQIMDGSEISYKEELITNKIKNQDMNLIPHPFSGYSDDLTPILIDPMDSKIRKIVDYQNAGGSSEFFDQINRGKFIIDNDVCKRCGPRGVKIHKMKFKYESKF